jgi:hypothetical protein
MKQKKNRKEILIDLMSTEGGRYMIEHTDTFGGHIINGDRKMTI